jgi:hypothetical protein
MQVPLAVAPRGPGLGLPGNLGDSPPAEHWHGLTWLGLGSGLISESLLAGSGGPGSRILPGPRPRGLRVRFGA